MDERALVPLLEAIYALDLDDRSWLLQVLSAATTLCGPEHSYVGFFYDASDVEDLDVWNVCAIGLTPELEESFRLWQQTVRPELVRTTFRSLHVGSSRRTGMPHMEPVLAQRESVGWGDIFNVNGLDVSGIGCLFTIGTREREFSATVNEMAVYARIAHHLAAAFRCRRRLGISRTPGAGDPEPVSARAEAILDAEGHFVHAEGEAAGTAARERIRTAAHTIDALRARGRGSGRTSLEAWHPLVGARWTLVDTFEEGGRRYVMARENQAGAPGFEVLTDRERQVVLHAVLGFTNKEIAYALGVSDSTVRVLMARAAGRFGVRSRAELLSHPSLREVRASRGGAGNGA